KWLVARGDRREAAEEADRLTPDTVDEGTVEGIIRLERAAGRVDRVKAVAAEAVKKGAAPGRMAVLVAGALADARDFTGAADQLLKVTKAAPASTFIETRLRVAEVLRETGS